MYKDLGSDLVTTHYGLILEGSMINFSTIFCFKVSLLAKNVFEVYACFKKRGVDIQFQGGKHDSA